MAKGRVLVVGAGFAGAVAARELAEAGYQVLVIDKRNHIGGNAYDFVNDLGIRVHKYGPHLWHTSNDTAHDWVSRFTEWVPYKHRVRAMLQNGKTVPLPINRETVETVFARKIVEEYGPNYMEDWQFTDFMARQRKHFERDPINSREHVEMSVGPVLCDLFFAPYTSKMWGMDLEDLPVSVAARIPTKDDYDPFYFPKDKHQYLPKDGYTALFKRIFDHKNITVKLSTERKQLPQYGATYSYPCVIDKDWDDVKFDAIFTSEPIDTYYNCDLGELPWRSIKFDTIDVKQPIVLDAPVVNFTHDGPCTRVTEWSQFANSGKNPHNTTLTYETPCDYKDNNYERYYPVKTAHEVDPNRELYKKYRDRAVEDGIHFIGRCGKYIYQDMAPCVNSTLVSVRKYLGGSKTPDPEA